jgi:peptidoglycan/LPS O-acetylase OafA/YrhL
MKGCIKHVDALDYIRGIAILSVLLFHTLGSVFGFDVLPWKGWFRDYSSAGSFLYFLPISIGMMGVPIFFVVSGFCIHLSFQQQGQRWGSFFIRRIFRIYPAYLAALVFFGFFFAHRFQLNLMDWELWRQFLMHFFLVHNFQGSTIGAVNGSFWSMAVEAQLYLLYPILVWLVAKFGWRRSFLFLGGLELLIRGADGLVETFGLANTTGGYVSWLFTMSPLGYWFSWALGARIADAFLKNEPLPFSKSPLALWVILAIVCYFVRPLCSLRFLLFAIITAAVTSKLLSQEQAGIRRPYFLPDALKKIGLWSYSIYLLHQPLFDTYSFVINWLAPETFRSPPVAFLLVLATWLAVIPFSAWWYKLFELPGIAWGKSIVRRMNFSSEPRSTSETFQVEPKSAVMFRRYSQIAAVVLLMAAGNLVLAAKFVPMDAVSINNLAWKLATSPDEKLRNGAQAVLFAEEACQQTHYQQTIMIGTLAAAYAEAGRFEDAVFSAQQACNLAENNGETNLLQKNQELLVRYQNRQPYRDGSIKAAK